MPTRREGKLCLNGCFQFLPYAAFTTNPRSPDGYMARCRSCERDRTQVRKHGLTSRQKALLAEWQGGCRICKRTEPGSKGWVVDHDHACCPGDVSCENCRRGILCAWCNSALGYAMDSAELLRAMADYLESDQRISLPAQFTDRWTEFTDRVARTYEDYELTEKVAE